MSKIESITTETTIDNFVKKDVIQNNCVDPINEGKTADFIDGIIEKLIKEMQNGGLDEYSLNIAGEAPFFEKTKKIIEKLTEAETKINQARKNARENLFNHRENEYKKLQELLVAKLEELKADRNRLEQLRDDRNSQLYTYQGPDYSWSILYKNRKIKEYETKLRETQKCGGQLVEYTYETSE